MSDPIVIVPTGTANLASVRACFRRLGADTVLASSVAQVTESRRVVLPGVGTFGAASSRLAGSGMDEALQTRIQTGNPTMAICVGMQLLAATSEESPKASGLGIIPEKVTAFADDLRVPQLGWSRVEADPNARFLTDGWAYFANSYRMTTAPQEWTTATSEYGGRFVSGLERGELLGCQFHPELSGSWGAAVVARWLASTQGAH